MPTARTMTHVWPLNVVLLSFLIVGFSDALTPYTWTKVMPDGEVHHSFLRSDPGSHRLFLTIWSKSQTLLSCSFTDNEESIRDYITLHLEDVHTFSNQMDVNPDNMQCTPLDSSQTASLQDSVRRLRGSSRDVGSGSGVKPKLRVKRGFIVPGTLWCGSGNKAPSYSDLGMFSETDKCCREHDQCQDTILSFHSKFGVFNSNIFTMSHCSCDNRFHRCLKDAQDSISDVVGYTFFNLLKMHCFEFSYKLQCTERNWFGMCKESKMALYAEVHTPTLYATDTEVNTTSLTTTTAMSTSVYNTQITVPASAESTAEGSTPISLMPPASTDTPHILTPRLPSRSQNQSVPLQDADSTEKGCAIYKYLDECRNRILPLQRKYGFRNKEPRTMYHCNCTERLLQSLSASTVLTEEQTLLLDLVSQTCFVLQDRTADCTTDRTCKVEAVRSQPSQVWEGSSAHVKGQRHLKVMGLRNRRPSLKRATHSRFTRLHKLCLRMVKSRPRTL